MQDIAIANKTSSGTSWCSPASALLSRRTIFLAGQIDDSLSCSLIQQLMVLDAQADSPISMIIDSPGGSVSAGLALIDCMQGIKSPVATFATGTAASMAAIVLACGEPGMRSCSPHVDVLVHQPIAGGIAGQITDIAIAAETLVRKKESVTRLLAKATGRPREEIASATERDTWLTAEQALAFGIVDRVTANWPEAERMSL